VPGRHPKTLNDIVEKLDAGGFRGRNGRFSECTWAVAFDIIMVVFERMARSASATPNRSFSTVSALSCRSETSANPFGIDAKADPRKMRSTGSYGASEDPARLILSNERFRMKGR
jgi:hypothetical protein